jgi:dihydropyrimidinase
MPLLIRNGEIITADSRTRADIYCEGETITRIGPRLEAPPGAQVVDAAGKYVFPGFIDPHVHITLPFMGTLAKDTYETGSRAALVGGTTTLIEMCCPAKADDALEGFEHWMAQAVGRSACDFTFHMGPPGSTARRSRSCARSSGAGSAPSRSSSPTRAPSGSTTPSSTGR